MSHEAPGKSDDWFTPRYIFDALGETFDLDVAAPRDLTHVTVPAEKYLSSNSLGADWHGFVWMNPPFASRGSKAAWLNKFFDHGNGIALTPDRSGAPWWHRAHSRCNGLLFTEGKPRFVRPDGSIGKSPSNNVTLWASGDRAVDALIRASKSGLGALCFPATPSPQTRPGSARVGEVEA